MLFNGFVINDILVGGRDGYVSPQILLVVEIFNQAGFVSEELALVWADLDLLDLEFFYVLALFPSGLLFLKIAFYIIEVPRLH